VQERLKHFVGGQLGIFTNGYWGHPAMKLSPEVNLMAVAHYLQALEVQRKANKIVSILGAKTPHIQNVAVGGVANPLATDSQSVLTVERLLAIKGWIDELADFVKNVYLIDVAAVGAFYADWTKVRQGRHQLPVRAGHPARHQGHAVRPARRLHRGRRPRQASSRSRPSTTSTSPRASRSRSSIPGTRARQRALHPYKGETKPNYTDFKDDGKYSWLKSPTFYGKPMQVGPLARVLNMLAAGHEPTKKYATAALDTVSALAKTKVGLEAMHSTIGRHAARAISLRGAGRHAGRAVAAAGRQHRQGRPQDLQPPVFPRARSWASASTRRRAARCRTGW
jgi:hydrogenase large subunit